MQTLSWCFCTLLVLAPGSGRKDHSLVDWSPARKLVWTDFRALPVRNLGVAALSSTSIQVQFEFRDHSMVYHIRCRFDKNSSWGRIRTAYILSNEQLHFDIAELFSRKLNRALKAFGAAGKDQENEVHRLYGSMMLAYRKTQEEYDRQTDFSINKPMQEVWSEKVRSELKELNAYAGYR